MNPLLQLAECGHAVGSGWVPSAGVSSRVANCNGLNTKGKLWRFFANLRKDLNIKEEQISPEERRPKND